jgi:hypothetical protein
MNQTINSKAEEPIKSIRLSDLMIKTDSKLVLKSKDILSNKKISEILSTKSSPNTASISITANKMFSKPSADKSDEKQLIKKTNSNQSLSQLSLKPIILNNKCTDKTDASPEMLNVNRNSLSQVNSSSITIKTTNLNIPNINIAKVDSSPKKGDIFSSLNNTIKSLNEKKLILNANSLKAAYLPLSNDIKMIKIPKLASVIQTPSGTSSDSTNTLHNSLPFQTQSKTDNSDVNKPINKFNKNNFIIKKPALMTNISPTIIHHNISDTKEYKSKESKYQLNSKKTHSWVS